VAVHPGAVIAVAGLAVAGFKLYTALSNTAQIVRSSLERYNDEKIRYYTVNKQVLETVVDYGKFRYEQSRKQKEAKKKQKVIEVKEIRMSPNIDTNDLNTKVSAARKFLEKGNRVKVTLRFRGREMAHMNNSKHILDDFAEKLADISVVEKAPKVEGRSMTMFLAQKK